MTTVVRTEKYQRGPLGKLIKWLFIVFNVLMLLWLVSAIGTVSDMSPASDAERLGTAIGATIGFYVIGSTWVSGALILGLFVLLTRGNKVIVEERSSENSSDDTRDSTTDSRDADALIARHLQGKSQSPAQPQMSTYPAQAPRAEFGQRQAAHSLPEKPKMKAATKVLMCLAMLVVGAAVLLLADNRSSPGIQQAARTEAKRAESEVAEDLRVIAAVARCCRNEMRSFLEKYGENYSDRWKTVSRQDMKQLRDTLIFRGIEVSNRGGFTEAVFDLNLALVEMKGAAGAEEAQAKLNRAMKQSAEEADFQSRLLRSRLEDIQQKAAADAERRKAEYEQARRDQVWRNVREQEEREDQRLRSAVKAQEEQRKVQEEIQRILRR